MVIRLLLILGLISVMIVAISKIYQIYQNDDNSSSTEEEALNQALKLSMKEAEDLLDSPALEENQNLINESLNSIDDSLKKIENIIPNLVEIPKKSYKVPTFLENSTNSSLQIAKTDFDLYNSKYEELINKSNNITKKHLI